MKTEQFTFSTLEYKRPDFQEFAAFAEKTKERIESAGSYAEVKEALLSFDGKKKDFSTDVTIASIRHTLDTRDKFYEGENEYIEETFPTIMPCLLAVDEALMTALSGRILRKNTAGSIWRRRSWRKRRSVRPTFHLCSGRRSLPVNMRK